MYGEPRFTADIDVNVLLDKRDVEKFLKRAAKFGFTPLFAETDKMVQETGVMALKFKKGRVEGKFDIILAENLLEYAAIRRSRHRRIASISVKVVLPEDLILHKIASSRPRDREDLQGIVSRQKDKLNVPYVERWLKRLEKADPSSHLLRRFHSLWK